TLLIMFFVHPLQKTPEPLFPSTPPFAQPSHGAPQTTPRPAIPTRVMSPGPTSEEHPKETAPAPSQMAEAAVALPPAPKTATRTAPPGGGKVLPPPLPHHSRGRTVLLILLMLLVVGAGAGFYYLASTHQKPFPVPS